MQFSVFAERKNVMLLAAVVAIGALLSAPFAYISAQAAPQGTLTVEKQIVGTTTVSADAFSFLINGANQTQFNASGSNAVMLDSGVYTVTEPAVAGYVTSYTDCENINLTASGTATCTITNTATTTATVTPPTTGTLVIEKVVEGGPLATSSFSFTLNGGATTTFNSGGRIVYEDMATGTYAIMEVPAANYTATYNNCMNADVQAGATTTCTITNTFNVGGGQLYEITGVKWHDEDEDGVIDGDESTLPGWTIMAEKQGEITRTDVTDGNGRYTLLVTAGEWVISEVQQSGWNQTYPSGGTHTVNASGTASTTIALGDYNFGNDDQDSSGGSSGGGGNGIRIELTDNDNRDDDDDSSSGGGRTDDDEDEDEEDDSTGNTPGGIVLGEQTSVYPFGAPNTGVGGMSINATSVVPFATAVGLLIAGFIAARAWRHPRDEERI